MKNCLPLILLLFLGEVRADYALGRAQDRWVLLVDLAQLTITHRQITLHDSSRKKTFSINSFWMQDRIWSDGICVGVPEEDPRSSRARVENLRQRKQRKEKIQVLIELVRLKDKKEFFVSFLKPVLPKDNLRDFFYSKKKIKYDAILWPFPSPEANLGRLNQRLRKMTTSHLQSLLK